MTLIAKFKYFTSDRLFYISNPIQRSRINSNKLFNRTFYLLNSLSQNAQSQIVLNIFDRKSKLQQRERAALHQEVEIYDYLKNEIGYRLADRIFDIKRKFKKAVDLGCGRGYVSKHVIADSVEHLTMIDSSQLILSQCSCNDLDVKVEKVVCDEEHIENVLEPESIELVISNLALHWINNLPSVFKQVMNILKRDGVFLGSMFGIDTLQELRSSLQLAESERKGGISPHVSPFIQPMDIGHLLMTSGFVMQTIDTDEIIVRYPSMFELMNDLKGMGESNAAWNRSLNLSRDILLAASVIYEQLYGQTKVENETDNNGVPATFQIVYFIGWKPDSSLPQSDPKSKSTVSFEEFYKFGQISEENGPLKTR